MVENSGRFQKGHPKRGGRRKGGKNKVSKSAVDGWSDSKGIPFLMRVAEGKEMDVNGFGRKVPAGLREREFAAQYLIDRELGKAKTTGELLLKNKDPLPDKSTEEILKMGKKYKSQGKDGR